MPTENKIDCPALHKRSAGYPFGDRVPRTVRMLVTATADKIPGVELAHYPEAKAGHTYRVWTNSHGAVVAVMDDGNRLGLRPAEFEVDSWHHLVAEPAPQPHAEPIAWMVGTAIWWTKEEAERDAAATGLPMVAIGPVADSGEVDRLRAELVDSDRAFVRSRNEAEQLRTQLTNLQSSVREFLRIDGISVDGSAARNKALTMLHGVLATES
ncbi:hypothetical protein [Pseudomonas sp.]|uniref:hypothetical protein n=1 Tax=Pseudomonas sp. TaxID=306 RepID=UPI0026471233|nr:hypothetical protein [Pseudomonas sp.]MDN5519163.1 hypothetical protein [Pseudomonas sp.]